MPGLKILTTLLLRYSLVFVLIETLETVFHRLFKHLEVRQKYSAVRRIFNSLPCIRISR